jgi:hypothetical protein
MKAPPIKEPEAKPTRAITMRLRKASFRPIKRMPMKAIRLTTVTDARIAIKSAIDFNLLSEIFYSLYYGGWLCSETNDAMRKGLPSVMA